MTRDCARVSPAAAAQPRAHGQPAALSLDRTLLACPEWDVARYVDREVAGAAHFCPNHGLRMEASGGGPLPIPLAPAASAAGPTAAAETP